MFKSISIKAKLMIIVISSITIISAIMLVESIITLKSNSHAIIEEFEQDALKTKEEELKNYVSLAMKTVQSYYDRTAKDKVKKELEGALKEKTDFLFSILEGEYNKQKDILSDEEMMVLLKGIVETTRYGKSGYFWINDTEAKMVMHPIKPSLNGKDLSKFEDKGGKKIFSEFAKIAKEKQEGYVDYLWAKPGFEKPQLKISYIKLFEPYNWVVGTGEYVDNVTAKLQEEALKVISNMKFGDGGYFWINNSQHILLAHGANPKLVGKDVTNLKDKKGIFLFQEIVKKANAKKEGGLVAYFWPKIGKDQPVEKFSYVQNFKEWDWIIGTGAYVDEIEDKVNLMKTHTEDKITKSTISNIVIILITMIVLAFIMAFISNKVIFKPLMNFQEGLLNFFKYINKENKDIQKLDDSANDEIGVMAKIINENVNKTKSLIEQDEALISDVKRVVEEVKKGHLTYKVEKSTQNETLQELKVIFNEMLENIEANVDADINKITDVLDEFTKLDFTHKVENPTGKVSKGLNELAIIINKLLLDNLKNGTTLEENATTLSANVSSLSTSSNAQAASLEETAAALEEITSTIISTTDNIANMAAYSNELKESIAKGQTLASSTVNSMNEINAQTQSIADAITVIDQIAFQTNILSLNAAVEAATAGEAGKGFAVVAQEVRNLASRSAEAAKEIKDLVETATVKTNLGKKSADEMIAGYDVLNENIIKSTDTINDIASSSKEQQAGIEQINDAITTLDQGTQQNAAVASDTAIIADSTSSMAKAIVDEANEANFIGKGTIEGNTQREVKATPKGKTTQASTPVKARTASPVKKVASNEASKASSKVVTATNDNDDEWESF